MFVCVIVYVSVFECFSVFPYLEVSYLLVSCWILFVCFKFILFSLVIFSLTFSFEIHE